MPRLQFYTVPEVSNILRISVRQVWRYIAEGLLRSTRFKGSTRVSASDLEDFIKGR